MKISDIAVIILNWNGENFLKKFLPTTINKSNNYARIIVADNGSTDGSYKYLKNFEPDIEIIRFDKNYGYTGGYNKALKNIKAKYYILLNSDIEVTDNWITPVIDLMEKDKTIAACQPKIKQYINRNMFEYAGAAGGFIDFLGYPFCRGRIFNTIEEDKGQYNDNSQEIFWASGACMFVRSDLFHKTSGFDEHFFAHMEEIDLCWRFKLLGKKVTYCPGSSVYHVGGGTLPKSNPKKTYFNFRNSLYILAKNLPAKNFYPILFLRIILDTIAAIKFLFSLKLNDCMSVLKAYLSFVSHIRYMRLNKPKKNMPKITQKYRRSIAWDYFIKRKTIFSKLPKNKFT